MPIDNGTVGHTRTQTTAGRGGVAARCAGRGASDLVKPRGRGRTRPSFPRQRDLFPDVPWKGSTDAVWRPDELRGDLHSHGPHQQQSFMEVRDTREALLLRYKEAR